MTTTTEAPAAVVTAPVNPQRQCALALAAILAIPGLPDATWSIYPVSCGVSLEGHLDGSKATREARGDIQAYVRTLGLTARKDQPCGYGVSGFTEVRAQGEFMGVTVKVWAAADKGGSR